MGKRGPARTPTAVLKLHGSHRAVSREGKEPKPAAAKPKSAVTLSQQERKIYNATFDMIKGMGLEAETDGNALARYAKNVVRYNSTCAFIEKHGEAYPVYDRHKDGTKSIRLMKRFPESSIRNELEATLIRLEREFGLTPAARASLQIERTTDVDKQSARFFGAGAV